MAKLFLTIGSTIFLVLGCFHALLTLRDIARPRAFTPTDDSVRVAMQGAQLVLNPGANLWQTWLGIHLSHSLGLIVFGGGLLLLARLHFPVFAASSLLQGAGVTVAAVYLVLSLRFWFLQPAIGAGLALLFILASVVLSRS